MGLAAGGCASQPVPSATPRMPRVLPAPASAEVAAVSTAEVVVAAHGHAARGDLSAAARTVAALPVTERPNAARELVMTVAERDPAQAARLALAFPPGASRMAALEAAASAWVRRDREAALRWVLALSELELRFDASRAVADRWVEADARAAMTRLLALPASRERDEFVSLTAARWARREAAQALAWAGELPSDELKTRVTTSIGFELAQTAPERAAEVVELLPAGRDRWLLLSSISQTWVARNPAAALAWVRQLPAGEARNAGIAGLDAGLGVALARPPVAVGDVSPAGVTLAGAAGGAAFSADRDPLMLPPGPERERALRRRFEEMLQVAPLVAATWLNSVPLSDRSDDMVNRLTRQWLASDPVAAETWLDQAMVRPGHKEELLREAGRRP